MVIPNYFENTPAVKAGFYPFAKLATGKTRMLNAERIGGNGL